MRNSKVGKTGWALALALAIGAPSVPALVYAKAKAASAGDSAEGASTSGMSKEDQDKVKEHNKLRSEIKKVKYPASKADVAIELPRPRSIEVKKTSVYMDYRNRIWDLLRDEVLAARKEFA